MKISKKLLNLFSHCRTQTISTSPTDTCRWSRKVTLCALSIALSGVLTAQIAQAAKVEKKDSTNTATPAPMLKPGSMAPTFSAVGHDGKTYSLADLRGKKNVVLEWFNNECPYVKKHYDSGNMQALQKKYVQDSSYDVVWFSVASSAKGKQGHLTPETAKSVLAERKATPTAILMDESGTIGGLYKAVTTPHMFVINKKGEIAYMGALDDNSSSKKESIVGAKNFVAEALESLKKGEAPQVASHTPYGCSVKYN